MGCILTLPCRPALVEQVEKIFLGTLGCVGLLKDWIGRALWRALNGGDIELATAHLKASAYHLASLKKIAEEIQEGESRLAEDVDSDRSIRLLLGIPRQCCWPSMKR